MEGLESSHTKESGHWYTQEGIPAYTIIGKNGKERDTTLRDAKKLGLLPSVTTIINGAAKPGLENWKQDQTILACLTLPRIPDEPEADYLARVKADAKEQARKAAERGTQIHAYVQSGFEGKPLTDEARPFFEAAKKALEPLSSYWICEKPFATKRYGGKADLHSPIEKIVVDIKTTEKDVDGLKIWDEHAMQLAAYRVGLGMPDASCDILYVNYKAQARLVLITGSELVRGLHMFNALVYYFYAKTGLTS